MRRAVRLIAAAALTAAASHPDPADPQADAAHPLVKAGVSDHLAERLTTLGLGERTTVLVHGTDLAAADRAVARRDDGDDELRSDRRRRRPRDEGPDRAARAQPGVTYVEGNQPIEFCQYSSNRATRGAEALQTLTGADGTALTGAGVSVAVIDSGVDPTHPFLTEADGTSAVVSNQKTVCDPFEAFCQVVEVPTTVDTDTLSLGGHGTHVAGIVAGRPTELADGSTLHGAAPGAKLVSLSTGAGLVIIGADAGSQLGAREPRAAVR